MLSCCFGNAFKYFKDCSAISSNGQLLIWRGICISLRHKEGSHGRPSGRWEGNIKMDLLEIWVIVYELFNDAIDNSGCLILLAG